MNSVVGNGGMMETIHPPFSPDHVSGFLFHCSENHPQAKKILKIRGHYVESVGRIQCS
jgi:hypothetical protein